MQTQLIDFTKKNKAKLIIISIIILGGILRIYGFTHQSYWLDELFSITMSNPDNDLGFVIRETLADVHPPLYQVLLWLSFKIFGYSEAIGRLLSVILGTVGLGLFYYLGKELFNKTVAQYATFLAALNYFLIYYSQETRSYSLLFALTTFSYLYLVKVLKQHKKTDVVYYLIITTLLLYTHYFGLFLVATQFFVVVEYYLLFTENRKKVLINAGIISFTLTIVLIPILSAILRNTQMTSFWVPVPEPLFFVDFFTAYFSSPLLSAFYFICIVLSLVALVRSEKKEEKAALFILGTWIFLGYFLPYLRSITAVPLLIPRSTIIVLPALILLIAYGIYSLRNKWAIATFLSVATVSSGLVLNKYYTNIYKAQWREVLQEVARQAPTVPAYYIVPALVYYEDYAKLLNLNLNILPFSTLQEQVKKDQIPSCFWLLDTADPLDSSYHTEESKQLELKGVSFHMVSFVQGYYTRAILISKEKSISSPQLCSPKTAFNTDVLND